MTSVADVTPLRLGVLDEEDLSVVSAHLQDAETRVGDMTYLPHQRRFVLVMARFDWPLALKGRFERCRSGLHFERVMKVSRARLDQGQADAPLTLLAIAFVPGDAPGGVVLLTFTGGGQVRLDVECLEAEMRDIGPRWGAAAPPNRDTDVVGSGTQGR